MYGQIVLRAAIMPQCTTGKSEPEGRRQQFQILLENRLAAFAHPEPIPVHKQRALRGDGHKLELRAELAVQLGGPAREIEADRKSTRLNSSHLGISYAVFC